MLTRRRTIVFDAHARFTELHRYSGSERPSSQSSTSPSGLTQAAQTSPAKKPPPRQPKPSGQGRKARPPAQYPGLPRTRTLKPGRNAVQVCGSEEDTTRQGVHEPLGTGSACYHSPCCHGTAVGISPRWGASTICTVFARSRPDCVGPKLPAHGPCSRYLPGLYPCAFP